MIGGSKVPMGRYLQILIVFSIIINSCDDPITNDDPPNEDSIINLTLLWEVQYNRTSWGSNVAPTPINDSLLLFTGDNNISCVNIDSGIVVWTSSLEYAGSTIENFVFDNHAVYGIRDQDKTYAIDINDGSVLWEYELPDVQRFGFKVCASNTHFFVGTIGDSTNDYKIWKFSKQGELVDSINVPQKPWVLTEYNGYLLSGQGWTSGADFTGQITCYSTDSLKLVWNHASNGSFLSPPVFDEDRIYVGTVWWNSGITKALDINTGNPYWTNSSHGAYNMAQNEMFIFANMASAVFCVDKLTGEDIWRSNFSAPDEISNMTLLGDYLYFVNYGKLNIVEVTSGEIIYSSNGPDGASVEFVSSSEDQIFVQTSQHLYGVEPLEISEDN